MASATPGIDPQSGFDRTVAGRVIVLQRQGSVVGEDVPTVEHLSDHLPMQILEQLSTLH